MPKAKMTKVQITESDVELLAHLAECRFLTIRQMAILLNRNDRGLARRLRLLTPQDVVRSARRAPSGIPGRPQQVLCLGEAGLAHLKANGRIHAEAAFDLFTERKIDCVDHELLVSEFRVQAAQLPAVVPGLSSSFLTSRTHKLLTQGDRPGLQLHEAAGTGAPAGADFVPDGVLLLHHAGLGKSLLFYLEVDMGTQPIRSRRSGVDLDGKIRNYRALFASGRYRRYEALLPAGPLRGFRLLVVCGSPARLSKVLSSARLSGPCDFIWATDPGRMALEGIWGPIWQRASEDGQSPESILGQVAPVRGPSPQQVAVPVAPAAGVP